MEILKKYKFEILFLALLLELIYPFLSLLFIIPEQMMNVIGFTILVFSSFLMANRKIPKLIVLLLGILILFFLWSNLLMKTTSMTEMIRIYASCFFFITLIYILIRNYLDAKTITVSIIFGVMSGYLLIGFFGASLIEMMDFHHPGSFMMADSHSSFDYYYFSFISLISVGYGDIVPLSSSAKSLTVIISLVGQFYMAIGLASFVGKLMNK